MEPNIKTYTQHIHPSMLIYKHIIDARLEVMWSDVKEKYGSVVKMKEEIGETLKSENSAAITLYFRVK